MFCYIRTDLSTYLQLSLCLSALLNWGQRFSSPSVSLTLTVPDIQEIHTGAAVVTYQQNFSPQAGAASILPRGQKCSGCQGEVTPGTSVPPSLPMPWDPHCTTCRETKPHYICIMYNPVKTQHQNPSSFLLLFFKSINFFIMFCVFVKDICFLCAQVVWDFFSPE